MNRRKLAIVAAGVVVALTGCLRFDANLTLSPDDSVTGRFIVAVKAGTGTSYGTTDRAMAENIWADYPAAKALGHAKVSDYRGDGYVGISVRFSKEPLTTFAPTATAWGITRVGDEFVVSGPSNATTTQETGSSGTGTFAGDLSQLSDAELMVAITFPGPVTSANGAVQGKTVTWNLSDGPATLEARGSAVATEDPAVRIAYVGFAVIALGAIAYALAGKLARRYS
ncbi:LppM family (lipo)protein [Demequina lutea]|uniref:LppM domain-containing protein n=1 Tax=Demequina lutea TaxID=431489 RepID=A0A7Y9Z770_9MICO|nr:hypothetical protein [Demequina lutea]NYI40074.1 hypothetical protein [Demequina lutea]